MSELVDKVQDAMWRELRPDRPRAAIAAVFDWQLARLQSMTTHDHSEFDDGYRCAINDLAEMRRAALGE